MTRPQRQTFTDQQVVEVYQDGAWRRAIVYAACGASPFGDYQTAGNHMVFVAVNGEDMWIRNDRRHIRPATTGGRDR